LLTMACYALTSRHLSGLSEYVNFWYKSPPLNTGKEQQADG